MVASTAELMGVEHIGIGTDLCQQQPLQVLEWMRNGRWSKDKDYGEGSKDNAHWPSPLQWFRDSRDFPVIAQGLRDRGFAEDEVRNIMGLNWLRLLESATTAQH
jgi:microsomal dipeptidase-like Zn-dependent dipeptidase